jgi:hypothetical protein
MFPRLNCIISGTGCIRRWNQRFFPTLDEENWQSYMVEPASVAHLVIRIGSGTGRIISGTSRWLPLPPRKKPNKVPAEYDTITSFRGHLDDVSFSHWISTLEFKFSCIQLPIGSFYFTLHP